MITFNEVRLLPHGTVFHHATRRNSDGTPLRVRKSGMVKSWAGGGWRMPVKYGLKDSGYIGTRDTGMTQNDVADPNRWFMTPQEAIASQGDK